MLVPLNCTVVAVSLARMTDPVTIWPPATVSVSENQAPELRVPTVSRDRPAMPTAAISRRLRSRSSGAGPCGSSSLSRSSIVVPSIVRSGWSASVTADSLIDPPVRTLDAGGWKPPDLANFGETAS